MLINGHELDTDRMIHEISLECAKSELEMSANANPSEYEDISKRLDRLLTSYIFNFKYLAAKADGELRKAAEID